MIELRWVDRYKIRDPKISGYQGERETVLQYRVRATWLELLLHGPLWSDWQDVPTVREP